MATGTKLAFCSLLWRSNGGEIDSRGRPVQPARTRLTVITDDDVAADEAEAEQAEAEGRQYQQRFIRGKCEEPHDCANCKLMRHELSFYPPSEVHWVCPQCVADLMRGAKQAGIDLAVPGHFTEGICMNPNCPRPSRIEEAEGLPGVSTGELVEVAAGFSRFLQVVIGPLNFQP